MKNHVGKASLLIFTLAFSFSEIGAQDVPWPTDGWTPSTPVAEGLAAEPLDALGIRDGDFGYIDRLVVVRHGRLVMDERYD